MAWGSRLGKKVRGRVGFDCCIVLDCAPKSDLWAWAVNETGTRFLASSPTKNVSVGGKGRPRGSAGNFPDHLTFEDVGMC